MKISSKGRYALLLLLDLAEQRQAGYTALKDIAKRQGISKKYLEQILMMLNKTNLLHTNRGYQGGYKLAVSPDKITVGSILRLTENNLTVSDTYYQSEECTNEVFINLFICKGLKNVIDNYLDNITIQDIIDKKNETYADSYII